MTNSFGTLFKITTFGESHGPAIGVVVDGCPAGLPLTPDEINQELKLRRPGNRPYISPRSEEDSAEILSGLFDGKTTGAPIAILIRNCDADPSQYDTLKDLYRPGHANFTYLHKYGLFDYRGGGRASARETACRVAAGAVAKKLLAHYNIFCAAFLSQIGTISANADLSDLHKLRTNTYASPIFCPDTQAATQMTAKVTEIMEEGDSIGGIVTCIAQVPVGLGDPVYGKLEALLASAMLSLPASKGFEIGEGFSSVEMKGSEHNDLFPLSTNFAGGTLGGISTGKSLYFRTAFKPASSIKKPQDTLTLNGEFATMTLPKTARHDPCVAIRAVPVVEAMTALVLADAFLKNQTAKL